MRKIVLVGCLFIGIFIILTGRNEPRVLACGGLFCQNSAVLQNAERIIFAVNDDGTITTIVGINYQGDAKEFSWILPVPSVPTLDVVETQSLDNLQQATAVQFPYNSGVCERLHSQPSYFASGGGGDLYFEGGQVGPYDYAVLSSKDANSVVDWLHENNYRVDESMIPLIQLYIDEEMQFLALKLSQGESTSNIQPIKITYPAHHPMIPIRLTAVAVTDNMPIFVWLFADQQYQPENYAAIGAPYANLRANNQVFNIGRTVYDQPHRIYSAYLQNLQSEYEGKFFVTQYAQSTSTLANSLHNQLNIHDPLLDELTENYGYVTMLFGSMSADQMTLDPTFIPTSPNAPDISNIINMDDWIDPLIYWGCSSRSALETMVNQAVLPSGQGYIPELHTDIVFPDGWKLQQLTINNRSVWVAAPVTMTEVDVMNYFSKEWTTPFLIVAYSDEYTVDIEYCCIGYSTSYAKLIQMLGLPDDTPFPYEINLPPGVYDPYPFLEERIDPDLKSPYFSGVVYGILTTSEDWQSHEAIYQAMLDYIQSYQFYTLPWMQHTLFLKNYSDGAYMQVPFPEHWHELTDENGDYVLRPTNSLPLEEVELLRLISLDRFTDLAPEPGNLDIAQVGFHAISETYELPEPMTLERYTQIANCTPTATPFNSNFIRNGRHGHLFFTASFVVEISTPEGSLSSPELEAMYQETVRQLAEQQNLAVCEG